MRFALPALLIALTLVVTLLALADTPASASRALPTNPAPYVLALRERPALDPTAAPTAKPTPRPTFSPTPKPVLVPHAVSTPLLAGWATTYDDGPGLYASAGPDVRRVMPWYHDGYVMVCAFPHGQSVCRPIHTVGWCACGFRHGIPTLLDLSPDAYQLLCQAPAGVCKVTVEVLK